MRRGAGAGARRRSPGPGTSFAIDREATARLLGFAAPVGNTLDAVASRDFALELLSALSVLAVTWSRVAQDFYVWCTHEFQMVDFPDSVASTSSIMPQKKNPVVLEHLKGRAAAVIGQMMTAMMNARAVRALWTAGREGLDCLRLLELAMRTATPNAALMLRRATADFASATELADALVKHADLSFRDAHHVVGAVVRDAMDRGLPANEMSGAMLQAAAVAQIGRSVTLPDDVVRDCLDPVRSLRARTLTGGPAPDAVRKSIAALRADLDRSRAVNAERKAAIAAVRADLRRKVAQRAGG